MNWSCWGVVWSVKYFKYWKQKPLQLYFYYGQCTGTHPFISVFYVFTQKAMDYTLVD